MYYSKDKIGSIAKQAVDALKKQKEIKAIIDETKLIMEDVLTQAKADTLELETDTDTLIVSSVKESLICGFDLDSFSKDYPELADKYTKTSTRKGYIKMSIKK